MPDRARRVRGRTAAAITAIAVLVVVGALVAGVLTGVLPGRAALTGNPQPTPPAGTPTGSPAASSAPPAPPVDLQPVLRPIGDEGAAGRGDIDRQRLAERIGRVDTADLDGDRLSVQVADVGSGQVLYRQNSRQPLIPASTTKVLTSAVALDLLGPSHTFSTRVLAGEGRRIVLVGGGDPYLAGSEDTDGAYPRTPSLEELAEQTAEELKSRDRRTVRLGYDASLFTGPAWNPEWTENYRSYVAPTSALWTDGARLDGAVGPRQQDPAAAAADQFADQLRERGITVGGVEETGAAARAEQLAAIESLPLEVIVQRLLMTSDNDAAEVIFRQVAVAADRDGSITEASAAVRQRLSDLGVDADPVVIDDGSGMNRQNRISADVLSSLVAVAASGDHPRLAPLLTGLPVAGVEGSLSYRFTAPGTDPGLGRVRAKTGTLNEVSSLAGYVHTDDGRLLSYAVMVNGSDNGFAATVWADRVSAAIAGCGCG